jgi:uncharacterized lipoprotein YddW (UPF0748 family)
MNVKANNIQFKTEELYYSYNSINSSVRGTNQLIIYTYSYNNKTVDGYTGTNSFGYEAAVNSEGVVIDVTTHVLIPEMGFVLSGHGSAATFIRENLEIGSIVTYDPFTSRIKVVNSQVNIEMLSTGSQLINAKAKIDEAKEKLYDVNVSDALINYYNAKKLYEEALNLYESNEDQLSQLIVDKCEQAKELLLTVTYNTMQSYVLEGRAIWHRPNEYNLDQIKRNLDKFQELGINLIYVETLWGYYSNYKSDILDMHPTLAYNTYGEYGKDYLKAYITEAHKRGIEVHAWAEIFSMYKHSKVATLHPDWLLINEDGSKDNGQGYFLDPANPEVKAFVITIIKEMLSKYDLDGFQYDYIRYPSEEEVMSGYTEYAMNDFKNEYGLTGDVKELIKNSEIKLKWDMYRRNLISQFVKEMTRVIREYENINISMAVAPHYELARTNYMQDWTLWIKNGWIDTVTPMVYVGDPYYAKSIAKDIQGFTKNFTFQYTGIGPVYFGFSVLTNQEQIVLINDVALGTAMFASHNLIGNIEFENALKMSTNRKKAVLPHSDVEQIVSAVFNDIIDKSERIYIPHLKMTESQKDELNKEFNRINVLKKNNAKELYEVKDAVFVLSLYLNMYANDVAAERINDDLSRLLTVLDIKISQDLINRGFWNPELVKERPDVYTFDYPIEEIVEEPIIEDIEVEQPKEDSRDHLGLIIGGLSFITLASGLLFYKLKRRN